MVAEASPCLGRFRAITKNISQGSAVRQLLLVIGRVLAGLAAAHGAARICAIRSGHSSALSWPSISELRPSIDFSVSSLHPT